MSLQKLIEEKIAEAIANGEFDNLPGQGKRLDLDAYFKTPEELRMGLSLLKSNNFIPAEVELLKEIEALKTKLADCSDEQERAQFNGLIQEKSVRLSMMLETLKQHRSR